MTYYQKEGPTLLLPDPKKPVAFENLIVLHVNEFALLAHVSAFLFASIIHNVNIYYPDV